jgi:hypothetical protein
MTCYRISHGEEPVALVASLGLARKIVCCQPPGHYRFDKVRVGRPIAEHQLPDWRHGNRLTTTDSVRTLATAILTYKADTQNYMQTNVHVFG